MIVTETVGAAGTAQADAPTIRTEGLVAALDGGQPDFNCDVGPVELKWRTDRPRPKWRTRRPEGDD